LGARELEAGEPVRRLVDDERRKRVVPVRQAPPGLLPADCGRRHDEEQAEPEELHAALLANRAPRGLRA